MNRQWPTVIGILAIVALIGAIAIGCAETQSGQASAEPVETEPEQAAQDGEVPPAEIIKVTSETFDAVVLQSETPVLVDFTADWCPPCRALHPTLVKLAADYTGRVKVAQINVDNNGDLANRYGVTGIPALFVIKNGQVVDRAVGLQSRANLDALLKKHLK